MKNLEVVLLQVNITFGNPQENYRHVATLFSQADLAGGELVVLPELWNTSYDLARLSEISDQEGNETKRFLSKLAQKYQVNIVGGSIARQSKGKFYNTTYLINQQGIVFGEYDKVHLFRLMNEDQYLAAGKKFVQKKVDQIPIGLAICYDLRFPELFRKLALAGAKLFVIPAQWPIERIAQWKTLLQARAIENQAFVVGINRAGRDPNHLFGGNSLVIDPIGSILLEMEQTESIGKVNFELNAVSETRQKIPVFKDRRPELY